MASTSGDQGTAEKPSIILVEPQLGENIGAAARAMLNCDLVDLRLVRPRESWPNPKARAAACGADVVLDRARVFDSTAEAAADLCHLYATTGRPRDMLKPAVTPAQAVAQIRGFVADQEPCGLLFGPERTGLNNDDVVLAEAIVEVPLNPTFNSLNLAHAVLLVAYEWFQATGDEPEPMPPADHNPAATSDEVRGFFEHLEQELDASGFLRVKEKRPAMVRNIRNLFLRAGLRQHEVRTLHGIISALSGRRKGGKLVGQRRDS